jgi:hypothetical protein
MNSRMMPPRALRPVLPVLLTACTLTVLRLSAAEPKLDPARLPAPATRPAVTYEKDIRPLLDKSCVKCHSGDKAKGDYHLDSLAGALKPGENGKPAIVPGQSAKSPLVYFASDLVEDMEMPPKDKRDKFPPLAKDQVALLRAWIDQGAK